MTGSEPSINLLMHSAIILISIIILIHLQLNSLCHSTMPGKIVLLFYSISFTLFLTCESKIVRGTVSSKQAWQDNGQFVTKFCFHGELSVNLMMLSQKVNPCDDESPALV